jgi:hypothetical protein
LTALRSCPQPVPERFLKHQPGSWVLLRPDDPAITRYKPVLRRSLDAGEVERLQSEGWGVHFSAHAFGADLSAAGLLCLRTLVVEAGLAQECEGLTPVALDRRKEQYLRRLATFPLRPHWLIETRLGVQALFRVLPPKGKDATGRFLDLQGRLNAALGGTESVCVLQLVRLPGTLQFGRAGPPSVCRLLEDLSAVVTPYDMTEVDAVLTQHPDVER